MEYDFWPMRESPFHQLSDFQCIFIFAFGEVKIICAFVTFSADPTLNIDDELLTQAQQITGMAEKTALVREGLAP